MLAALLIVTQSSAGPFGVDPVRDTPASLGCTKTDPSAATFYVCNEKEIPKPLADFRLYTMIWREDVGICSLSALTPEPDIAALESKYLGRLSKEDIARSSDLLKARYIEDLAKEYTDLLTEKYGQPETAGGFPIWRGDVGGVDVEVKLIPADKLMLHYKFDQAKRDCIVPRSSKVRETPNEDSL